ncbi:hypothetical protein HYS10_00775 [Candidatus Collierbacteria bacterium]|nr:hypothetical protein [Candidatus Collierbacteria bacterium]
MTKIKLILTTAVLLLVSTKVALAAAGDLSVKISQPKSPTNQSSFNVNFVALDSQDPPRPITVKCFKKGPSDSSFSQFGSDFNLAAGGNSDNCVVDTNIIKREGTYQFYVNAIAGSDSVDSSVVSVDFNTSGPGTPTDYSKEQTGQCSYKLRFKTSDDGGKTTKVEFYRSDKQSFTADSGTEFASMTIGSNVSSELNTSVPDCGKTYYFALRAFDSAGNGSGLVGDTITTTTIVNSTTTTNSTVTTGPLSISGGESSQVGEVKSPTEDEKSEVTITPTTSDQNQNPEVEGAATTAKGNWLRNFLLVVAFIAAVYVFKKKARL